MVNQPSLRGLRRAFVVLFYVGCASAVLLCVVTLGSFFLLPLVMFGEDGTEFVDLPGPEAHRQLQSSWPSTVDPADVRSVSSRTNASRDSYSTWTRLVLSPDAAAEWTKDAHRSEERSVLSHHRDHFKQGAEGVRRTIAGPPSTREKTGDEPAWWTPPSMKFEATEAMLWYRDYDSGVARATWSAYDENNETLWIYSFAAQHHLLWPHGEVPEGERFSNIR
jgi:hypothetical protein